MFRVNKNIRLLKLSKRIQILKNRRLYSTIFYSQKLNNQGRINLSVSQGNSDGLGSGGDSQYQSQSSQSNSNESNSNFTFLSDSIDLALASKNDFDEDENEKDDINVNDDGKIQNTDTEQRKLLLHSNQFATTLETPFTKKFYRQINTVYDRTLLTDGWTGRTLIKGDNESVEYFYKKLDNGQFRYKNFTLTPNKFKRIVNVNIEPSIVADQQESILYTVVKNVSFKIKVDSEKVETKTLNSNSTETVPHRPDPFSDLVNENGFNDQKHQSLGPQTDCKIDSTEQYKNRPTGPCPPKKSPKKVPFTPTDFSKIKNLDPNQNEDPPIFLFQDIEQKEAFVILTDIQTSALNFLNLAKEKSAICKNFVMTEMPTIYNFTKKCLITVSIPFEMVRVILNSKGGVSPEKARLVVSEDWQHENNWRMNAFTSNSNVNSYQEDISVEDDGHIDDDRDVIIDDETQVFESSNLMSSPSSQLLPSSPSTYLDALVLGADHQHDVESKPELTFSKNLSAFDFANSNPENSKLVLTNYQLIHQITISTNILKAFGYNDLEYFYHKFTILDQETNAVHMISISVDDENEREKILKYENENLEKLESDKVKGRFILEGYTNEQIKSLATTKISNFRSHLHISEQSENKTLIFNDYSDELTKAINPNNWFSRKGLETGFTHTADRIKNLDCSDRFDGTVNECMLGFVKLEI